MPTQQKPFREIAAQNGLTHETGDGWYGPFGLYGVERREDGLLHAVGTGTLCSTIGVTNDVAEALLFSWCPDIDEMNALFAEGDICEATNESISFVRVWDLMAPGTQEQLEVMNGAKQ